ncbi:hypothetical protein [Bartonella sp. HY406]|uniref:hypothetical protein n=1 Tax=Bartonella sp. HY406 TaxID=2979331 RepID=UPI0021C99CF3|nr:hypothetical protein [Bartonella sp. HY406]UXN02610.1 hypothetical protein N6B01_08995 [Bartonella sp. HY406]
MVLFEFTEALTAVNTDPVPVTSAPAAPDLPPRIESAKRRAKVLAFFSSVNPKGSIHTIGLNT